MSDALTATVIVIGNEFKFSTRILAFHFISMPFKKT